MADGSQHGVGPVGDVDVQGPVRLHGRVAELKPGTPPRLLIVNAVRPQLLRPLREMKGQLALDLAPASRGQERIQQPPGPRHPSPHDHT